VQIEHAGDPVESESVHPELIEPIPAIGKKEMENLGFAVVETTGPPCRMNPMGTLVKILIFRSIETA